jgi:hypothetical protein
VRDGFPIYGPYGFSSVSNSASTVRRMISGYVLRNGQNGTQNLTATGRTTIPQWAVRLYNVAAAQSGPAVSSTYPLDRYMEDKDYLGDLTNSATGARYIQGVDFDLDEYNGRWCVTPEFPQGTYAYFVSISSNGTPVFPYNIGRAYYGSPAGGSSTLSEVVVTNYVGGANAVSTLNLPAPSGVNVVLSWSGVEGGSYRIEGREALNDGGWTALGTNTLSGGSQGSFVETNGLAYGSRFYRVERLGLAAYDGGGTGGGTGTVAIPGGMVSRGTGTNITVSITLPGTPPSPPPGAPVQSVTLAGSISGTGTTYAAQGTVVTSFAIPTNGPLGAQNVVVTFSIPGPTYTFTGGLTINP